MSINVLHFHSYSEPKKFLSGALALLMHIMFIAMMVFGLSWKNQPPEGMIVDLWSELPKPVQEPEPVASREPSKAIPPSEPLKSKPIEPPKPEVPVKPESSKQTTSPKEITPPIKKPDIELKQKPEPIKEIKPNLEDLKKKEIEERLKKIEAQKKEQELEKKQALEKQKEIEKQKQNIIANDNDNIDDFIDCKLIKPLTVLKYIYPHPTNVRTSIVCRVLNEEKCKLIVVERLDFIILQLKIFNSNMNY